MLSISETVLFTKINDKEERQYIYLVDKNIWVYIIPNIYGRPKVFPLFSVILTEKWNSVVMEKFKENYSQLKGIFIVDILLNIYCHLKNIFLIKN